MRYTGAAVGTDGRVGNGLTPDYLVDRALKERTIGAVVLVAFAVLIVPVFLDGPSEDRDTITEVVTLPGQNDQPRKQQTIVLERDRTEPMPVAQTPAPAAEIATPPPRAQAPQKTPAAAAKTGSAEVEPKRAPAVRDDAKDASPEASTTGMWAVQLGSFSNRANAERLASDLREEGFAAFLSRLDTGSGELHRVRIGPQKDRDAAETVAAKLTDAGHEGQVVPHP